MNRRHFYMSPPKYFEIEYEINNWMDKDVKVIKDLAQNQWEQLYETYIKLGVEVTILDPIKNLPDLVFPGDSVFLYNDNVVGSNFYHVQRRGEVAPRISWFREQGFKTFSLPNEIKYEGNADTIKFGSKFLGGYGVRSDKEAYPLISSMLDIEIIPIKFNEPSFHLDVTLVPLPDGQIIYSPSSFDQENIDQIEKLATKTIKVSFEESQLLAVNSIVLGDTILLSTKNAPNLKSELKNAGFNVISFDTSEFLKSGGGVKCLTLEHYHS